MANKQNAFIFRTTVRAGWLLAALALLPIAASAKGYSPAVAGSTVAWTNATIGKAQLSSAGAVVVASAPVSINVATGLTLPAIASAAISGASLAGAWGAAIGVVGVVAIAAIPQIAGMMKKANVGVNSSGQLADVVPGCSANCAYYSFQGGAETSSFAAACQSGVGKGQSSGYGWMRWNSVIDAQTWGCKFSTDYGPTDYQALSSRAVDAYPDGPGAPITVQEAQAKITANAPTVAEVQALVDANFPPVLEPKTITGPASLAGPNTVKLGLDGSSQTETCKYFLEYFPSNIKAHPECTTVTTIPEKTESKTVTTTNPDGTTSTSVISTKTPATSKTETTTKDAVENKDKTECEQYPNRLGCAELDVPIGEIPKITKSVSYREETLFGSGSCPADLSANIGTLHQTVKIWDWQKTCEMALPLRALVLSLATFAALLIIMPGGAKS